MTQGALWEFSVALFLRPGAFYGHLEELRNPDHGIKNAAWNELNQQLADQLTFQTHISCDNNSAFRQRDAGLQRAGGQHRSVHRLEGLLPLVGLGSVVGIAG